MIERIEHLNNLIEEALILVNSVKEEVVSLYEELEQKEYDDE